MPTIFNILLLIGGVFGLLGSGIAYLITFNEYKRRDIRGKSAAREASEVAAITFAFFVALSCILGYIFLKSGL